MLSVHRQGTRAERSEDGAPGLAAEVRRPLEARQRPRAELLDQLLQRQPLLALINLAAAGLTALTMSGTASVPALVAWLTFVLLTQLVRIIAYLRALQMSQKTELANLPPELQDKIQSSAPAPAPKQADVSAPASGQGLDAALTNSPGAGGAS